MNTRIWFYTRNGDQQMVIQLRDGRKVRFCRHMIGEGLAKLKLTRTQLFILMAVAYEKAMHFAERAEPEELTLCEYRLAQADFEIVQGLLCEFQDAIGWWESVELRQGLAMLHEKWRREFAEQCKSLTSAA